MAEALSEDPNVKKRRLGIDLRRHREELRLSPRQVAVALEWSASKVTRIETGAHGPSVSDLRALLTLYQVTDPATVGALLDAARESRGKPWWDEYSDVVSPQFARVLGYDGMAGEFRVSHPFLVPGLLHTEAYASALFASYPNQEGTRSLVQLRLARQKLLFAQPGVSFTFIVGEESLYRWVGGAGVMRQQLEHLIAIGRRDNISIHIVPFSAGAHPGLLGPFVMLFDKKDEGGLLFVESVLGDQVIQDDPQQIGDHVRYIDEMRDAALDNEAAESLLLERIESFRRAEHDPRFIAR
jgi:transcriptional regulator with XRE-family HTH domain